MKSSNGALQFSPSDVIRFLDGNFAAWMDRRHFDLGKASTFVLDDATDEEKLVQTYGLRHEAEYLAALEQIGSVIQISRDDPDALVRTREAIEQRAPVIYQAALEADRFFGFADFLQLSTSGADDGIYEPWDTKLARTIKPYFVVQLCAYAEMLAAAQGTLPTRAGAILGSRTAEPIVLRDYWYAWRQLRKQFLAFHDGFDASSQPDPGLEREYGRWKTLAETLLEACDHPSRVAGITLLQISRLAKADIVTRQALAERTEKVPRMAPATLDRLRKQASLQHHSVGLSKPLFEVILPGEKEPRRGLAQLPPASSGDVYFDMEGFPFAEPSGLEYLFGAVTLSNGVRAFHDWWAHDSDEERRAFEEFIDWAFARWQSDPGMHIYHYAAYEESALKRLAQRYATREQQLDELLRHNVLVDLYTVVRQGLVIGAESYSLKVVERCWRGPRKDGITDAAGSVVAYEEWLVSGQPRRWQESPRLSAIRDYNRVDCESTLELAEWLRPLQVAHRIQYCAAEAPAAQQSVPTARAALAAEIKAQAERLPEGEVRRLTMLVANLLEYHRRENKPAWWKLFECAAKDEDQLFEDADCLAGLERTDTPPRRVTAQSKAWEFSFDADQETRIRLGGDVALQHDWKLPVSLVSFDGDKGVLELKTTRDATLWPDRVHLMPNGPMRTGTIEAAMARFAAIWRENPERFRAVAGLLGRCPPRIADHAGGELVVQGSGLSAQVIDLVNRLDHSVLCIQGPPGTGKSSTAARVIADLLRQGKRVTVTAQSHKVIANLMNKVCGRLDQQGIPATVLKVNRDQEEGLHPKVELLDSGSDVAARLGAGAVLVGATVWGLAYEDLQERFDYLFIDEAGQFALANAVVAGLTAKNIVLVGDQQQLSQVVQGSHPPESGLSALEYMLAGQDTIAPDFGILLDESYRLHPDICEWISDAFYGGRLRPDAANSVFRVAAPADARLLTRETGIVYQPVAHHGNTQASDEEARRVVEIVHELIGRTFTGKDGERIIGWNDILIVAPYNMQVRRIKEQLPLAQVGSVDRFQGQEAPVVIVSMCASTLDEVPRGADFLLSPNRLNVAVSRAQALAIVVASPGLLAARCKTLKEMKLVNVHCWLEEYASA